MYERKRRRGEEEKRRKKKERKRKDRQTHYFIHYIEINQTADQAQPGTAGEMEHLQNGMQTAQIPRLLFLVVSKIKNKRRIKKEKDLRVLPLCRLGHVELKERRGNSSDARSGTRRPAGAAPGPGRRRAAARTAGRRRWRGKAADAVRGMVVDRGPSNRAVCHHTPQRTCC